MKIFRLMQSIRNAAMSSPTICQISKVAGVGHYLKRPMSTHGLKLREPAMAITTQEGRISQLFQESLVSGTAMSSLHILPVLETQTELTYCAIAVLCSVLNALKVDPRRVWKGPFRWYVSSMLITPESAEKISTVGLTMEELTNLAKKHGLVVETHYASDSSLEELTRKICDVTSMETGFMIVNYSRKVVGQAGSVHYAPIAAYHKETDMVLVLDVAKYKYPCHWIPTRLLWDAISTFDEESGKTRGFMIVRKAEMTRSTGL